LWVSTRVRCSSSFCTSNQPRGLPPPPAIGSGGPSHAKRRPGSQSTASKVAVRGPDVRCSAARFPFPTDLGSPRPRTRTRPATAAGA
jgi:hypothetical protein